MLRLTFRHAPGQLAAVAFAILSATCASPTKPGPIVDLVIQTVIPSAGPATGGTDVTIRGTGFAAGIAVSIGGQPATDVTVLGTDTITAKTPASAVSAPVDIVIALQGRTHRLIGGFRYDAVVPNTAPVIKSIAAQGRRPRQPAAFADYGETIQITTVVEDAEKAAVDLVYEWKACGGTFSGTGPQVEWTAPATGSVASTCTVHVAISDGPHVVTSSITVHLHNSIAEVGALARQFLEEFANNFIPAATTVRNFSDSCPGKASELSDVTNVRANYRINAYFYDVATVSVAFGGTCKTRPADACVITPVEWRSTHLPTGLPEVAKGISTISGVYRESRWWLCDSLFDGMSTLRFWSLR